MRAILKGLDEAYPAATCALKHENPFQLLISTILSAQCTDVRVNQVTATLFPKYPNAKAFAYANPAELEQEIRPTGFFRNKTKSIMGASKKIVEEFQRRSAEDDGGTADAAGRGAKDGERGARHGVSESPPASWWIRTCCGSRGGSTLSKNTDPKKIEQDLMQVIPQDRWILFSHQLIWHGRRVCQARKPKCIECNLERLCYSKDKTN